MLTVPLRLVDPTGTHSRNVVLVRPATITTAEAVGEDAAPPLGIAYIAACLKACGHEVSVVDGLGDGLDRYGPIEGLATGLRHGLADEEIIERIDPGAEIIGVSIMFSLEWPFTRALVEKIRAAFPHAFIVAGGEHITALPEYSLGNAAALDCCVLGEGEQTMVDLVEALSRDVDLRQVSGLCVRDGSKFLRTQAQKRLRELGTIPRPAWELVPIRAYLDGGVMTGVNFGRSMPMLASRGCPYRCTFCSNPVMWGTLWRPRAPRDVFAEICDYMDRYGASNFDFYDLTAIVRRDWTVEFCKLIIASGRQLTWQLPSGTRSEAIDAEVTRLLYESGCRYVNYAPESGSEEILERIKKRISKPKMIESMRAAVRNGIKVKANFILGFPGERLRHVVDTYRFIVKMSMIGIQDISVFPFSPYPGSELFEFVRQRGDIVLNEDYFLSLSQYTDPRYTKSYCENLAPPTLRLLCLLGMALFYLVSYLRRPLRFVQLLWNVFVRKEGKTKLESALVRVMKKRDQMRQQPRAAVPGPLRVPGSPPRGPARQRGQAAHAGTAADCRPVAA